MLIRNYERVPTSGLRGENKVTNELNTAIVAKFNYKNFSDLYATYLGDVEKRETQNSIEQYRILTDRISNKRIGGAVIVREDYDENLQPVSEVGCRRCNTRRKNLKYLQANAFLDLHNDGNFRDKCRYPQTPTRFEEDLLLTIW